MSDLNIKSSTIEKSLDIIKDFLQKIIGPSADELGLMISDNLKLRRFKNQLRNFERIKKIVEKEGVDIKQVNLKVLVPYLEGVSLEEDVKLQEIWANMFVNYIDSSKNLTLNVYPNILTQLSTNEITLLEHMESNKGRLQVGMHKSKEIHFTMEEVENLARLGLIEELASFSQYGGDYESNGNYRWEIEQIAPEQYFITYLGDSFLSACKR